jgi:Fur family ferric uptake transcriptional regulator
MSRRLRLTSPRRLIWEHLNSAGAHAGAETIYGSLREGGSRLGRATVFRTLKLFAQLGLAAGMDAPAPRRRFEAAAGKSHHDHMTCLGCGAVVEFSNRTIERLQKDEARRRGFLIVGHCLEVTGYCRSCRARRRPGPRP